MDTRHYVQSQNAFTLVRAYLQNIRLDVVQVATRLHWPDALDRADRNDIATPKYLLGGAAPSWFLGDVVDVDVFDGARLLPVPPEQILCRHFTAVGDDGEELVFTTGGEHNSLSFSDLTAT